MRKYLSFPGSGATSFRRVVFVRAAMVIASMVAANAAQAEPGAFAECTGRIERASDHKNIGFAELAASLSGADAVLFGERHGVRDHSQASACVLSAMARGDRPVSLVMEMFDRDDQSVIDNWRANHPENASGLGVRLEWWKRGWPAYENWLPLVDRAFSLRAGLYGGDIPQKQSTPSKSRSIEISGIRTVLGKATASIERSWQAAMASAHCGMLDDNQTRKLALEQIERDLSMAEVASAMREQGAVLVHTGRGHSRKDRSLFVALNGKGKRRTVSIGAFTSGEKIGPEDRNVHDFIWIVGSDRRSFDPCSLAEGSAAASKKEPRP